MTISMYHASVPSLVKTLTNLTNILEKGAEYAETKKIDPTVLINTRLYPDMFPLARQVQIASDIAKNGISKLSEVAAPVFEDNEKSFPELITRIEKTIIYLNTITPEQIDGSEEKAIALEVGKNTLNFGGMAFLLEFVLPNVYFHVTTTYNILRHCGVEIGKRDFLGKI